MELYGRMIEASFWLLLLYPFAALVLMVAMWAYNRSRRARQAAAVWLGVFFTPSRRPMAVRRRR